MNESLLWSSFYNLKMAAAKAILARLQNAGPGLAALAGLGALGYGVSESLYNGVCTCFSFVYIYLYNGVHMLLFYYFLFIFPLHSPPPDKNLS